MGKRRATEAGYAMLESYIETRDELAEAWADANDVDDMIREASAAAGYVDDGRVEAWKGGGVLVRQYIDAVQAEIALLRPVVEAAERVEAGSSYSQAADVGALCEAVRAYQRDRDGVLLQPPCVAGEGTDGAASDIPAAPLCPTCRGRGIDEWGAGLCSQCQGEGHLPAVATPCCATCDGTGRVLADSLDGEPPHESACPTCDGAGVVWRSDWMACPDCGGAG